MKTTHIELDKQLNDALQQANQDSTFVKVPLDKLLKIRDDVATIKELLFKGETKFVELAVKMEVTSKELKDITNG